MAQIYGNLIVALEKVGVSRRDLAVQLNMSPNTLTSRFNSDDTWTLKEMNIITSLLHDKGLDMSMSDIFERV